MLRCRTYPALLECTSPCPWQKVGVYSGEQGQKSVGEKAAGSGARLPELNPSSAFTSCVTLESYLTTLYLHSLFYKMMTLVAHLLVRDTGLKILDCLFSFSTPTPSPYPLQPHLDLCHQLLTLLRPSDSFSTQEAEWTFQPLSDHQ